MSKHIEMAHLTCQGYSSYFREIQMMKIMKQIMPQLVNLLTEALKSKQ